MRFKVKISESIALNVQVILHVIPHTYYFVTIVCI